MNLSPRWVAALADAGLDATHLSNVGSASDPDVEIAAFASAEGMVVMTNDLDFGALLSTSGERGPSAVRARSECGPSAVQLRASDLSPEAVGTMVVEALRQMEEEIDAGALVTIEPDRARLRLPPITRNPA